MRQPGQSLLEGAAAHVANADARVQRLDAERRSLAREQSELETSLRVKGSADLQAVLGEATLKVARSGPTRDREMGHLNLVRLAPARRHLAHSLRITPAGPWAGSRRPYSKMCYAFCVGGGGPWCLHEWRLKGDLAPVPRSPRSVS